MKALVYEEAGRLEMRELPDPRPADTECLVRIEASGICGSDMHAYLGHDARRPAPLVLGHEAAGTVCGGPLDGTRVTVNPLVTCGACAACASGRENICPDRQIVSMPPREGTFAEYVCAPEGNLVEVPQDVPLERAALAEPIAVAWHAARLALMPGERDRPARAAVIGGGAIGLSAALCLQAQGCPEVEVVERNPARRERLREILGRDVLKEVPQDVPAVIDAVGAAATRQAACAAAAPGGVIVHVGLAEDTGGVDARRLTLQEIAFVGTYTYTAQDFRDAAAAMFDGSLGPLDWFESRPLEDGAQAFRDLLAGAVAAPKVVLRP